MLHSFQQNIVTECLELKSGGLILPMGSGKTLISLKVATSQIKQGEQILIVASKSLIGNWQEEIKKWYPEVSVGFYHLKDIPKDSETIILTTPSTLSKFFKENDIGYKYVRHEGGFSRTQRYPVLKRCLGRSGFYGTKFGALIVDEAQEFSNIKTIRCKSICSIFSTHRWLLSGTLFSEPKLDNIFGFYRMLNHARFPCTLPEARNFLKQGYAGYIRDVVYREKNEMFKRPKLKKEMVDFLLSPTEEYFFNIIKNNVTDAYNKMMECKARGDAEGRKMYNAYLLSMIVNMRMFIVSPRLFVEKFMVKSLGMDYKIVKDYLNSGELGSRIEKVMEKINHHDAERVVVFNAFRKSIDLIMPLVKGRKVYTLGSNDTVERRQKVIGEFNDDPTGVLFLTYQIGAEGLNLQSASVVLLVDVMWNSGKTSQAIARVFRYKQTKPVSVYSFISNTNIEKAIHKKHIDKLDVSLELQNSASNLKIQAMKMKEIVEILSDSVRDYIL